MQKIDPSQYVSIGNAAKIADVTRGWMRHLASSGKVRSVQIDGLWFVLRTDAQKFSRDPARGRPRE